MRGVLPAFLKRESIERRTHGYFLTLALREVLSN